MSEYAQRFAENRIDFSVLPDLTDQDLEKLDLAALGHVLRRRNNCVPRRSRLRLRGLFQSSSLVPFCP
jgi:SAM domain (Sterile alpha motif)